MFCLGRRSKRNKPAQSKSKMLVSEGSIFNRQVLRVRIASMNGAEWEIDIDPDLTVEKLKVMALGHFLNSAETIKTSSQYKLVLASQDRRLNNEYSVAQEGVRDNDELLLLQTRDLGKAIADARSEPEQSAKGPDESVILQRTAHLCKKNHDRVAEDSIIIVDFQTELRKTLVSLIDTAQKIQLLNKKTLPLLANPQDTPASISNEAVDPRALRQLIDMGFSAAKATRALLCNKMSSMDALEYLLQPNPTEAEGEGAPPDSSPIQSPSTSHCALPVTQEKETNAAPDLTCDSGSGEASALNILSLPDLMEAFRAYKRKVFRPNPRAFNNLKEMGFDEEKITDSLRVNGNQQDQAFEWLISRWPTAQDFSQGLDPDGPIYKAIRANSVIQLGLNNPKVLYAFLHMLENPSCANHWFNDPDTAPLLSQIFKIYHTEKYSLQVRTQYASSS